MTVNFNLSMEYHSMLNSLIKERTVDLLWTPGQRGNRSNGIAYDLVRLGTG